MTRFKVLGLVQAKAATEKSAKLLEVVALVIKKKKKIGDSRSSMYG